MLILVAVSVAIVINSGLIERTKEAAESMTNEYRNEAHYGEKFTIGETEYNSIDEYMEVLNGGNSTSTFKFTGLWGEQAEVTYEFTNGMTWADWVPSDLNPHKDDTVNYFYAGGGGVSYDGWILRCSGDAVSDSDPIVPNATYYYYAD